MPCTKDLNTDNYWESLSLLSNFNNMKVAAINSKAQPLQITENIAIIKSHLDDLCRQGVEFALFPELSVSGYLNNTALVSSYATMHDATLAQIKTLSEDYDIIFSVGHPMPRAEHFVIAQSTWYKGEMIHCHTKTHLSVHEKEHFVAGNALTNLPIKAWNVGLQLCLESHYPELSLTQQKAGAELLCFAMASPRETAQKKYDRLLPMFKTRAYDNACFVMSCNLLATSTKGEEYAPVAMVLSPRGEVLAKAVGESYCIAELDYVLIENIKNSMMSNFPAYRQMNIHTSLKCLPNTRTSQSINPLMFVGTGSDVGKSVIAAAYCRILLQDGFNPAPYKSQNMSLNSYVSKDGGEMGRAQAVQAEACNIPCHTDMNPILLKPCSDKTSQVVLHGKPVGNYSARSYFKGDHKASLFNEAMSSFDRLAAKYSPIVIEGAGSVSELNLKQTDIVNMRVAVATNASTIIIADIDRGGVFASLYGSVMLLDEEERQHIKGFVINKFRGDVSLFDEGRKILEDLTGIPVLAIIPTFTDIYIEDEDSVAVEMKKNSSVEGRINIAVVLLHRMSNFTDFARLEQDARVNLFYTNNVDEVKKADVIILPGTKSTIADLKEIKSNGIAQAVHQEARNGKTVIGICGGYQMMGMLIEDPDGVEGSDQAIAGLGILPTTTVMEDEKTTVQQVFRFKDNDGCKGYEIHMGNTSIGDESEALITLENGDREGCMIRPNCWGTYMHGVLDNQAVIEDLLAPFDVEKGEVIDYEMFKQQQYDLLADHVRAVTDMGKFYEILGVNKEGISND